MSVSELCSYTQGSAPECAYTVSPLQGLKLSTVLEGLLVQHTCMTFLSLISLMLTVPAEVFLCTCVCHTPPHALVARLIDSPYVPLMNGNACSAD